LCFEGKGLERPVLREVCAVDARLEGLFLPCVPFGAQQLRHERRDGRAMLLGRGEHFIEARRDSLEL